MKFEGKKYLSRDEVLSLIRKVFDECKVHRSDEDIQEELAADLKMAGNPQFSHEQALLLVQRCVPSNIGKQIIMKSMKDFLQ